MSNKLFRGVHNSFKIFITKEEDGTSLPLDEITDARYEILGKEYGTPIITKVLGDGIVKGTSELEVSIEKDELNFNGLYWHKLTITDIAGRERPPVLSEKIKIT